MNTIPQPVAISPALHQKLLKCDGDMQAIQQMMQMFQQSCQAKIQEANARARSIWEQIGQETGIDLRNVSWEPHPKDAVIVPTQVRVARNDV